MINSNVEKLELLSWLSKTDSRTYSNSTKVQKFIFFYEAFCRTVGATYDLGNFKIWMKGPVDSVVYGDYTYREAELRQKINDIDQYTNIDVTIAKKSHFLVQTLTTTEISNLSHEMDYWKRKSEFVGPNSNVQADESDISSADEAMLKELFHLYDEDLIDNSEVIHTIGGKHFVISKDDYKMLDDEKQTTINQLAVSEELDNPVFLSIADDGVLEVD